MPANMAYIAHAMREFIQSVYVEASTARNRPSYMAQASNVVNGIFSQSADKPASPQQYNDTLGWIIQCLLIIGNEQNEAPDAPKKGGKKKKKKQVAIIDEDHKVGDTIAVNRPVMTTSAADYVLELKNRLQTFAKVTNITGLNNNDIAGIKTTLQAIASTLTRYEEILTAQELLELRLDSDGLLIAENPIQLAETLFQIQATNYLVGADIDSEIDVAPSAAASSFPISIDTGTASNQKAKMLTKQLDIWQQISASFDKPELRQHILVATIANIIRLDAEICRSNSPAINVAGIIRINTGLSLPTATLTESMQATISAINGIVDTEATCTNVAVLATAENFKPGSLPKLDGDERPDFNGDWSMKFLFVDAGAVQSQHQV